MSVRRLPVYILVDTSGSMRGEPIESVNTGLQSMISYLRQDPFALESVYISIITFNREVKQVIPLTELELIQLPRIDTPESGPTHTGEALEILCAAVDKEVKRSTKEAKGDWMPLLFLMTDGAPSDLQKFRAQIPEIQKRSFGSIVACAAGPKSKESFLKELTDTVVHLDTTDSSIFQQFFKWVSSTVSVGNRSMGSNTEIVLPPPPPEVQIVI